ncbi:TPA: hypothetical protein ACH3X2_007349 [Trebouxia sp. C0005]
MRSTAGKANLIMQSNSTQHRSLSYTAYEGNSWEVTFDQSGVTVLVDPWLEGDLVFANQTWLYRGQKGALKDVKLDIDVIGAHADVILLSQGLDDHSHKPTLERLPKDKLVVGSPAAAAVCQSLGFTNVYGLDHGKTMSVCNGRLQITATAGALVGPPWSKRENGFVLSETQADGVKLYYEPHCDYDEAAVAKIGKVDAVVTPANSQVLINFPLVKGKQNALKLIQSLQPSVVIPLINAKFHQSGPLSKLIHAEGSPEDLQGLLQHAGLQHVKVRMPAPPGKSFAVTL